MDKEKLTTLEKECQDIADKLGNMLLQEKGQRPQGSPQQKAPAAEPLQETTPNSEESQKEKKKRQRKKKNRKVNEGDVESGEGRKSPQESNSQGKKKRNRRRRPFEDRYFGRFHCKICNRMWESAHVFTVAGTKKVKYRQGCKECNSEEAWYYPYALDIILCSICVCDPCECRCVDCDGLIHTRSWENPDKGRVEIDPHFEYCECENEKTWILGEVGDLKKPHLSDFCGKCKSGRFCVFRLRNTLPHDTDGQP